MVIVQASPELARAAHTIIATGMALHLMSRAINIRDDLAVAATLRNAGFGQDSINALRFCAVAISSRFHVISNRTH